MSHPEQLTIPCSTYRIQFHKGFTLSQGNDLVHYLNDLGISDLYSSPLQKASPGSTHGYDVVDHSILNPEVGTFEIFQDLSKNLANHGMGFLLDIVPNHMGIQNIQENVKWSDVLEFGWFSVYSHHFDIDWQNGNPKNDQKVMVPILGDLISAILDKGELKVIYNNDEGSFKFKYWDNILPINPSTYSHILHHIGLSEVENQVKTLSKDITTNNEFSLPSIQERQRVSVGVKNLKQRLRELVSKEVKEKLEKLLEKLEVCFIEELLSKQSYRLCFWKVTLEELDYRRFFDITSLVGLRMEDETVFKSAHELFFKMSQESSLPRLGLRTDHPDGLLFPKEYFDRLQEQWKSHSKHHREVYLIVEKILQLGEDIRDNWPVFGTVGYDFMNYLNGIFVKRQSEHEFRKFLKDIAKVESEWDSLEVGCKTLIMNSSMKPEITSLSRKLYELSSCERSAFDLTIDLLRRSLILVISEFPVYRTYIGENGKNSEEDNRIINQAIEKAKKRASDSLEHHAIDFLGLVLNPNGYNNPNRNWEAKRIQFVHKFQQVTGPVTAKGLEDTAFYRYPLLTSLCEVGGNPNNFGIALGDFHALLESKSISQKFSHSMNSTSTHDTKRSEDLRMRINVLSEIPHIWERVVQNWKKINQSKKEVDSNGHAIPDDCDEYFLYQSLIGVWSVGLTMENRKGIEDLEARVKQYLQKAMREAKVHSFWTNVNATYEQGVFNFLTKILNDQAFLTEFIQFQRFISKCGMFGSLSQVLLKLTTPGVPDFYQGCELWDFSLVDPDNRRPVDFELRKQTLNNVVEGFRKERFNYVKEIVSSVDDGRIKMFLTQRVLSFRREHYELFTNGKYQRIHVDSENVVAFSRSFRNQALLVVVSRFFFDLLGGEKALFSNAPNVSLSREFWGKYSLPIPHEFSTHVTEVLTNRKIDLSGKNELRLDELFEVLPFAILVY